MYDDIGSEGVGFEIIKCTEGNRDKAHGQNSKHIQEVRAWYIQRCMYLSAVAVDLNQFM